MTLDWEIPEEAGQWRHPYDLASVRYSDDEAQCDCDQEAEVCQEINSSIGIVKEC